MESEVNMHDVVALLEDVHARHVETGRPLLLRRGQIGTIVMAYDGAVFILPVHASRLMILRDTPDYAVA